MLIVEAGQKAPAIEGAMPAGGPPTAACCHERRFRHIPFEWQLSDQVRSHIISRIGAGVRNLCIKEIVRLLYQVAR
jgi:hypothetical protein